mmetsp:Transcript_33118/g.104750  ORF Transcript_33118/g.104750 Transcript_33118/m.104750 type:complete len:119 (-) Transcript_33118:891-1247(-)
MNLSSLCARHEKKKIQRCAEENTRRDFSILSFIFAFFSMLAVRSLESGNSKQRGKMTLKFTTVKFQQTSTRCGDEKDKAGEGTYGEEKRRRGEGKAEIKNKNVRTRIGKEKLQVKFAK